MFAGPHPAEKVVGGPSGKDHVEILDNDDDGGEGLGLGFGCVGCQFELTR